MALFLFTIDTTFSIPGRGTVLTPGVGWQHSVRAGMGVELHQPDGRVSCHTIKGVELLDFPLSDEPIRSISPLLIDEYLSIARGTDVWLVEQT